MACFPVQYQDKYYKDVSETKSDGLCKFAYWNGFVVGAACARIEPLNANKGSGESGDNDENKSDNISEEKDGDKRIYIMTLGVLAAYRGRTIGAQLIQSILDYYEKNKNSPELKDVKEISLHVQISNDDALKFYIEKFGFEKGEVVENYYKRIDPPHCYKLFKTLP